VQDLQSTPRVAFSREVPGRPPVRFADNNRGQLRVHVVHVVDKPHISRRRDRRRARSFTSFTPKIELHITYESATIWQPRSVR
jgi:hypothetical protein